ncbi:hypothetical protein ACPWT1_08700 [Ramlibacter sp. MMS24-I3-19]|uniref:hypothetical protein n=1 Tax=Ramlibacter sp. MMS24-I3-19 TaxID=3416606 RepID=UPI003D042354
MNPRQQVAQLVDLDRQQLACREPLTEQGAVVEPPHGDRVLDDRAIAVQHGRRGGAGDRHDAEIEPACEPRVHAHFLATAVQALGQARIVQE